MTLIFVPAIIAVIALWWILRRERLAAARGEVSSTHPVLRGIYLGCAFLGFLFFVYVAGLIVVGVIGELR